MVIKVKCKNYFKLYSYEDALIHCITINKSQLEYYMWLELPHELAKYLSLYEITEIKSNIDSKELDFKEKLKHEHRRPWICAESILFNTDAGYHMYKFSFWDSKINDIVLLYFSYRIQTDNPNKSSYVYMKRRNI